MRNDIDNDMGKALCRILEKKFNEYCKELDESVRAEPHVFSETFCKKMDKLIRHSKRPWYSMVSTPMKKVAVAILAFLVVTFTSVMSIRAAREAVIGFFVQVYETFSVVFFGEDNANEEAPEGRAITEPMPDYEITALPEGYRLVDSTKKEWMVEKWYKDSNGKRIKLSYMMENMAGTVVLDTEKSAIKYYEDNGKIYSYVEENMFVHFVWESEGCVFSLKVSDYKLATELIPKIKKI